MLTITISGPAGSGKSTVAKLIAKNFGLRYYSVGSFFRKKASEAGLSIGEFMKTATASLHNEADNFVKSLSKKGNIVIDGRLSGYMAGENANFKIFINAPVEVRAKRISKRENLSEKEILEKTIARDKVDRDSYQKIYGIDICDLNIYDFVLDNEHLNIEETKKALETAIKRTLKI